MKFKSDIEVEAGIKDSSGAIGTAGQVLSSTGSNVSWVTDSMIAERVQHRVKAGVAINKGQAVYVTGADGTNVIVGKASNASEATSSKTLGLIDATVAINGFANVVEIGGLAGLNTIGSTVGDPVWLGVDGNLIYGLANKPYAPQHLVFIGIVTRVNSNNGEIFINVQNGFELKEIHDVDIITNVPVNGDILGYDGTLWVNKTIAEWLGYTPADQAITISTTAPLSGGGNLSANRTLSIAQATATTNGYLSSADWTNFNDKQTALNGTGFVKASGTTISYDNSTYVPTSRTITINGVTQDLSANQAWTVSGGIDGSGTVNTLSKFTGTTTIGDSQIKDSGTSVSIGYTTNPNTYKLDVNGDVNINTDLYVSGTFPYTIKAAGGVNVDDALGVYWKTDVGGIGGTLAGIGQSSSGLDFYTNSSLLAPKLRILANGNVTIGTLAGSGTRLVTADASGNLSTTTDGAITTYNSTLTLTTSWQNTGIDSSVITTSGVYLVSCFANDFGAGGGQYSSTYVGTMYFYAGGTNGVNANEITLHHSGHADNGRYIYLRTLGSLGADSKLYLQIKGNGTNTGNSTYVFTFKKLL